LNAALRTGASKGLLPRIAVALIAADLHNLFQLPGTPFFHSYFVVSSVMCVTVHRWLQFGLERESSFHPLAISGSRPAEKCRAQNPEFYHSTRTITTL
jgi:hypothetical protein